MEPDDRQDLDAQAVDYDVEFDDEPMVPTWAKVVGWISVCWGGVNVLCLGCGVVGLVFFPMMLANTAGSQGLPPSMSPGPLVWVFYVLGLFNTILLIIAGVLTLNWNRAGRTLHLAWAGLGLVLGAVGIALQFHVRSLDAAWYAQHPDSPLAQGASGPGANIGFWVGLGVGVILGFAWPIFCLIWFGAIKKRTGPELGSELL